MKKLIAIILAILIIVPAITAEDEQSNIITEIKSLTETGYFTFSKEDYMKAIALCQRVLENDNNNVEAKYFLAYSAYRLMNIAMVNKEFKEMAQYKELGLGQAESLLDNDNYKSEVHTLIAAITMMELATDPSRGMELSGRIHAHLQKAISANRDNPRAYLVQGIMINNTPEMYGGGADKSIPLLMKAAKLFEVTQSTDHMPSWGRLENFAWLGQALAQNGKLEEAKRTYEKALSIKPDFNWVKYNLLPALEKRIDNTK